MLELLKKGSRGCTRHDRASSYALYEYKWTGLRPLLDAVFRRFPQDLLQGIV